MQDTIRIWPFIDDVPRTDPDKSFHDQVKPQEIKAGTHHDHSGLDPKRNRFAVQGLEQYYQGLGADRRQQNNSMDLAGQFRMDDFIEVSGGKNDIIPPMALS